MNWRSIAHYRTCIKSNCKLYSVNWRLIAHYRTCIKYELSISEIVNWNVSMETPQHQQIHTQLMEEIQIWEFNIQITKQAIEMQCYWSEMRGRTYRNFFGSQSEPSFLHYSSFLFFLLLLSLLLSNLLFSNSEDYIK